MADHDGHIEVVKTSTGRGIGYYLYFAIEKSLFRSITRRSIGEGEIKYLGGVVVLWVWCSISTIGLYKNPYTNGTAGAVKCYRALRSFGSELNDPNTFVYIGVSVTLPCSANRQCFRNPNRLCPNAFVSIYEFCTHELSNLSTEGSISIRNCLHGRKREVRSLGCNIFQTPASWSLREIKISIF